jgi:hypothetical protein
MRTRWKAYWGLVAATLAIYLTMVLWSLRRISLSAGGQTAFDLRPSGYDFEAAQGFLAALDPAATAFYLDVQQTLDTAYPAMLAAVLAIAIFHLYPGPRAATRFLLLVPPIAGAVFDYLENAAVARMLTVEITPEIVAAASRWTVLKSAFTSLAMFLLATLLLLHFWRRWQTRKGA